MNHHLTASFQLRLPRLILRPLKEEDAHDVFEAYSDAEAMQYRSHPPMNTIAEAHQFIDTAINHNNIRMGIELIAEEKLIGSLLWKKESENKAFIGYSLNKLYWNKGYASEAVKAWIDYIVSNEKSDIFATVFRPNQSSINLLEKLGFTLTDTSNPKTFEYRLSFNNYPS